MTTLRAIAPAKINLGLEIVGTRADGYHEVATVMQAITLYDHFIWEATGAPFEYVGPVDVTREDDLVWRVLRSAPDIGAWTGRLTLDKRIPIAAGLGGGSVDAAFALRFAFPEATEEEIGMRASALGADVPFFLRGGAQLATGIGTQLEPLPTPRLWFVLITPPFNIVDKTRALYAGLNAADVTTGETMQAIVARVRARAPLERAFPNPFARQLLSYPEVRFAGTSLLRAGARRVNITGAGPTMYAVFMDDQSPARVAANIPREAGKVVLARGAGPLMIEPLRQIATALRGRMTV